MAPAATFSTDLFIDVKDTVRTSARHLCVAHGIDSLQWIATTVSVSKQAYGPGGPRKVLLGDLRNLLVRNGGTLSRYVGETHGHRIDSYAWLRGTIKIMTNRENSMQCAL